MDTFNLIVFLWQVSLVVSGISFFYGLFKRSWVSMLISFLTILSVAYYFNGAENGWRLVALFPILVHIITTTFWWIQRNSH